MKTQDMKTLREILGRATVEDMNEIRHLFNERNRQQCW